MLIKKGTVNNKNHNLSIIDKEERYYRNMLNSFQ